jgi:hypothetical protein
MGILRVIHPPAVKSLNLRVSAEYSIDRKAVLISSIYMLAFPFLSYIHARMPCYFGSLFFMPKFLTLTGVAAQADECHAN